MKKWLPFNHQTFLRNETTNFAIRVSTQEASCWDDLLEPFDWYGFMLIKSSIGLIFIKKLEGIWHYLPERHTLPARD